MNLDNTYKDFKTFMEVFKTDPIYDDLILRYRKDDDQLIYYDGNKIAKIDKENILSFPINTYKCNYSELEQELKSNNRRKAFENIRKIRQDICGEASCLFDFEMESITLKSKSKIDDTREYKEFDDFLKKPTRKVIYEFKSYYDEETKLYNTEFKFIDYNCKNAKSKVRKIILIQYEFIKIFKFNYNNRLEVKDVNFNGFEAIYRKNRQKNELATFFKNIKNAIDKYKGKEELEKKYQHQFMLSKNLSSIFGDSNGLYYFEQEYGIINKNRNFEENGKEKSKKGRIDAIFYRVRENILTNIYLVELKVDNKVISNESGVLTHIDDINNFLSDSDQIKNLKNYIETRYKNYEGYEYLDTSNPNISFCTVISFTEKDELKGGLTTLRNVLKNGDPNSPQYLKEEKIDTLDKEYKYKFYYEQELWNKKHISGKFKLIDLDEFLNENISIEDYING